MFSTYLIIIILAFLSGITTLIGVFFAICCHKSRKLIAAGIGFSVGIMVIISLFELIAESLSVLSLRETFFIFILGAFILYVLNLIIPHTHLIEEGNKNSKAIKTAYLVAFGLILHDFPEGFAMANSYLVSPNMGILIAISIALHNIPEEFAMTVPIVAVQKKKFLYKAAFISGLAEPLGALIGISAVHLLPTLQPVFLSFAAGAMVFISFHELYPMARKYREPVLFGMGILSSILVFFVLNGVLPK